MLLVVDNGSIYTKQLTDFLENKKIQFKKETPESISLDSLPNYHSIILSGRRKNNKKTNEVNSKIVFYCIKNDIKLLGICYGAEILALTLGGTIKKNKSLQKGNQHIKVFKNNFISPNSLDVFESHSFEISRLPACFTHLAESENCKYEVIQYQNQFIFGTQFHPEMSPDGHALIEKFCSL